MALTFEEVIQILPDAVPVIAAVKEAIDAVAELAPEERRPSHYIDAAAQILEAVGPLADRLEVEIKD